MKHIYILCLTLMSLGGLYAQSFAESHITTQKSQDIQRVRLNLQTPTGYVRQLLLGFTPDNAATDQYDYGYDALNNDNYPDDFGWIIDDEAYIIQGVGNFSPDKLYPIGMFLSNGGDVTISLHSLENFESPINVYIYDTLHQSYSYINETNLITYSDIGNYKSRFFITFRNDYPQNFWEDILSIESATEDANISVWYNKAQNTMRITTPAKTLLSNLKIYDVLGKEVAHFNLQNKTTANVSTHNFIKGVYIIKLTTTKGILNKKIIIN